MSRMNAVLLHHSDWEVYLIIVVLQVVFIKILIRFHSLVNLLTTLLSSFFLLNL